MLTSKQRAQLRALANPIDTIMQVGKGGVTENLITTVSDALEARELIKLRVLENSDYTPEKPPTPWQKPPVLMWWLSSAPALCSTASRKSTSASSWSDNGWSASAFMGGASRPLTTAISPPHACSWSRQGWIAFWFFLRESPRTRPLIPMSPPITAWP